jgi:Arc/MetJ family transcription regulator
MRTRTNIEIDDRLMRKAMQTGKGRTKRAVVEAGLRLLVQTHAQTGMRRLKGKIRWEGDLSTSRQGRVAE